MLEKLKPFKAAVGNSRERLLCLTRVLKVPKPRYTHNSIVRLVQRMRDVSWPLSKDEVRLKLCSNKFVTPPPVTSTLYILDRMMHETPQSVFWRARVFLRRLVSPPGQPSSTADAT